MLLPEQLIHRKFLGIISSHVSACCLYLFVQSYYLVNFHLYHFYCKMTTKRVWVAYSLLVSDNGPDT